MLRRSVPGVHERCARRLEVADVARGDLHAMHEGDCRDLAIGDVEPSPGSLGLRCDVSVHFRCALVESEDPAPEPVARCLPEAQLDSPGADPRADARSRTALSPALSSAGLALPLPHISGLNS